MSSAQHVLIGSSATMQAVRDDIERVAATKASVLISGETGTGKEIVAHRLHALSPRRERLMIALHCQMHEQVLEAELFGSTDWAYTGSKDREGLVGLADHGTLLLDELQVMPRDMQAKLLRLLEDGTYRRLGDAHERKVDLRVLAATNADPEELVEQGVLRKDLFYRLNQYPIRLPSLRERIDDLPELAQHLLALIQVEIPSIAPTIDASALELLRAHHWPGNVRELKNTLQCAGIRAAKRGVIRADDLPASVRSEQPSKNDVAERFWTRDPIWMPASAGWTPAIADVPDHASISTGHAEADCGRVVVTCRELCLAVKSVLNSARTGTLRHATGGPLARVCPIEHARQSGCEHTALDILNSGKVSYDDLQSNSDRCASALTAESVFAAFAPALETRESFYTSGSTQFLRWILGTYEKRTLTDEALRGRAKKALRTARELFAPNARVARQSSTDSARGETSQGLKSELELYKLCFPTLDHRPVHDLSQEIYSFRSMLVEPST